MTLDGTTARLADARTILLRVVMDLPEGETRQCALTAYAACGDALASHTLARTRKNLEVLADTLAAPGTSEIAAADQAAA